MNQPKPEKKKSNLVGKKGFLTVFTNTGQSSGKSNAYQMQIVVIILDEKKIYGHVSYLVRPVSSVIGENEVWVRRKPKLL